MLLSELLAFRETGPFQIPLCVSVQVDSDLHCASNFVMISLTVQHTHFSVDWIDDKPASADELAAEHVILVKDLHAHKRELNRVSHAELTAKFPLGVMRISDLR